jgi:hypothetical protein
MTVFIRRLEGEQSTICRMRDLIRDIPKGNINIDDLVFDQFITVLKEDINFDPTKDTISYRGADDIMLPIANERSWKAAIGEMYTMGVNRFAFSIGERCEYSTLPSYWNTYTKITRSNHMFIT